MNKSKKRTEYYAGRLYRLLTGCFGVFLLGIGFFALFFTGPLTIWSFLAAAAFALFGGEMVVAARRAKESWLSKLGPFF